MATLVKRGTLAGDYHEHPINPVKIVFAAMIVAVIFAITTFFYFAHMHFVQIKGFDFWPFCWATLVRWPYFWQQHFLSILAAGAVGFFGYHGFWLWRNPKG